jgi:competence protein ComEC
MIPFVIGILLGVNFDLPSINLFFFIGLLAIAISLQLKNKQSVLTKRVFLICVDVFFFLLAINLVFNSNTSTNSNYYRKYLKNDSANFIIATISDLPIEKEKFIKCRLDVNEVKTDSGYKKAKGVLIAYFKKADTNNTLKVGNTIVFKTKLLSVDEPKNPYEFNYKRYLSNKQIFHTAFINKEGYSVLPIPVRLNSLWYNGLLIKQYVLQKLKTSKLSDNAYGICAALLTGYDDEIDKQVVDSFSHSGTLHVLSVSGLHTGLIYLVLSFLFDAVDRKRKYKLLKFLIITGLLWGFALITGFSAPVLRAVIMFNLLGFGKIFFRSDHRNQINILLVSAFILLSYDPFFITDVGFLLSYFAVFGLLYFQPKLASCWEPKNYFFNWLWQGTTVSFAATISTLPLTLFYFKQFPLWFFVCNIIVVPASFLILMLAILIVLKIGSVAIIINYITNWLIAFITFFNSARFGYIDSIDFTFNDALFLTVLIILVSIAFQTKSYKQVALSFVILIGWQIFAIANSFNSKSENMFVVYQINKKHSVLVKNTTTSVLNELDSSKFMYHTKPHVISFNNTHLAVNDFNYVSKKNKSILILTKANFLPDIPFHKIDYLVLANNFRLTKIHLQGFSQLKAIIIDGSNNSATSKKNEELSRKFGIELIKTKQTGAYILNL